MLPPLVISPTEPPLPRGNVSVPAVIVSVPPTLRLEIEFSVIFAEAVTVPSKVVAVTVVPAVTGPLKVAVAPLATLICIPLAPELSEPPASIVHCPPESIVSDGRVTTLPPLPLMRPPLNTCSVPVPPTSTSDPVLTVCCVSVPLTPSMPLTSRSGLATWRSDMVTPLSISRSPPESTVTWSAVTSAVTWTVCPLRMVTVWAAIVGASVAAAHVVHAGAGALSHVAIAFQAPLAAVRKQSFGALSVNAVHLTMPEDWPIAVSVKVRPRWDSSSRNSALWILPSASATTVAT